MNLAIMDLMKRDECDFAFPSTSVYLEKIAAAERQILIWQNSSSSAQVSNLNQSNITKAATNQSNRFVAVFMYV